MTLLANFFDFFVPALPPREMLLALGWWAVIQIFALAALPLTAAVFRNAPDRGWAFSKSGGILGVTYVAWLMGSSRLVPYSRLSLLLAVAFVALAGVAVWITFVPKKPRWGLGFLRARWRLILALELGFLYMLMMFANIRTYCPEAMFDPGRSGAEKFGNMTHLQSIYHSTHFPPADAWFGGLPLNYYYFGHLQVASVGKVAGIGPEIAFNLGLATIVALTFLNAAGLVFWMTRRIGWALAAGWAVTVFGNLDGAQQFVLNWGQALKDTSDAAGWHWVAALDRNLFHPFFDFWRTSRIVDHTITEFPWFSAILGDLHPHHMSLSNWLLTLAVLLAFWRSPGWTPWWRQVLSNSPRLVVLIMLYGLCKTVNTWDLVTLMGCIVAILTARAVVNVQPRLTSVLWWFGGNVILLLPVIYIGGKIFVAPFDMAFEAPMETGASTFQPLPRYLRTWLSDYFVHFGLFLLPILAEIGFMTVNRWKWERGVAREGADRSRPPGLALILGLGLGLLFVGKGLTGYLLPGFCLATMLLGIYLAAGQRGRGGDPWAAAALALFVFCQTVVLFVEFYFVNDRYGGLLERYNTLFKFWYPLWPVYGVVAGWASWRLWGRIPRSKGPEPARSQENRRQSAVKGKARFSARRWMGQVWSRVSTRGFWLRGLFGGVAVGVFCAGMTYPLASTANRTGVFNRNRLETIENMERAGTPASEPRLRQLRQSVERTLDARAYMAAEPGGLGDDFGIMEWLLRYENGTARILEGNKHFSSYGPWGRMATMTGNKTLVGWGHHEHQWRPDEQFKEILNPTMIDIIKIYQTTNWDEALALLIKHDVDYVMVGGVERKEYRPEQLKKFEDNLPLAVQSGQSRLYRMPKPGS